LPRAARRCYWSGVTPDVPIGRRGFLRLTGFGAAMAALSSVRWDAPAAGAAAESASALRALSEEDARILSAIAERMVFTGDAEMPLFSATDGLASIDAALAGMPAEIVTQLHWGLLLFEYGPPVLAGRLSTYSGLEAAAQDDYLRGWAESRFATRRLVFQAFKNLSYFGYYSQDATWKGISYDGPWVPRPRRIASLS
jgi:hypothetical protein